MRRPPAPTRLRLLIRRVLGVQRRMRIALLVALVALPALYGGWRWLRSSPLVAVSHVRVSGLHGAESGAIESALIAAAHRMSTLAVNAAALKAAVAPYPLVRDVQAVAGFPHSLRITVVERPPVAALAVGNLRTAVAADGMVLGPGLLSPSLPTLGAPTEPPPGTRLKAGDLLEPLAVLGAAPGALAKLVVRVYDGSSGLTAAFRGGELAYFGTAARPHAKWASLVRVLADPGSAGASYVDVRVPAHPAAGFPAGVAPPLAAGQSSQSASTSNGGAPGASVVPGGQTTVAAIAAALSASGGSANTPATEPESEKSHAESASPEAGGSSSANGAGASGEGSEAGAEASG